MAEAHRILATGGYRLVHELCLLPNGLDAAIETEIRTDLARSICVNARPLTVAEWTDLFASGGFEVEKIRTRPMSLLQPRRLLSDEGFGGVVRIIGSLLRDGDARRRVLAMRSTFRRHDDAQRGWIHPATTGPTLQGLEVPTP